MRKCPARCCRKCLTRFRLPWEWDGKPVLLQSRSTDEAGNVQPTHAAWKEAVHSASILSDTTPSRCWQIGADNTVKNIYV